MALLKTQLGCLIDVVGHHHVVLAGNGDVDSLDVLDKGQLPLENFKLSLELFSRSVLRHSESIC